MDRKGFSIKSEERGKVGIVSLEGILDESAGEMLVGEMQKKIDAGMTRFVLDFSKVRNISSPAVAAVLDMAEKITDTLSGKVLIAGLSDLNLKIFEMVGIFLYADACPTVQEAEVKASM